MKKLLALFAAIAALSTAALAAEPVAPASATPKTEADLAYDAVFEAYQAPLPEGLTRKDRAWWELYDKKMQPFVVAARAFADKYPTDPRRYNGLIQSSYTRPFFIKGFKPEFDAHPGEANLIVDQAALNSFRAAQIKYLSEIIVAPDALPRHLGGGMNALIIDSRADAKDRGVPFDIAPIRAVVERVIAQTPDARALTVVDQFTALLKQESPAEAKAFTEKLQGNPTLAAAYAEAEAKRQAAAAEKMKQLGELTGIKFTAADGREVSIAALKGKVVLIDFWATWCGPCIAELPNVVANYQKYHDKGFEVVGITLENPGQIAKDASAEVIAAKMDAAKKKMLEFTVKNGMPWPQYFDGKYWKNDLAVKFGINSIPAMFLLDQDGKIVSTEARGPKLEAELKRLLKL